MQIINYLKKIFGQKNDDPSLDFLEKAYAIGKKSEIEGFKIADDCIKNGLRKGEIVKLSDIDRYIKSQKFFVSAAASAGFTKCMLAYIKSGEIICFNFENEKVFVHKDYASSFLNRLNANPPSRK